MKEKTKQDVANAVYERLGVVSKDNVEKIVSETFVVISDMLKAGQEVRIHKFGLFALSKRKAYRAQNDVLGRVVDHEERILPRFRISTILSKEIDAAIKGNTPSGK